MRFLALQALTLTGVAVSAMGGPADCLQARKLGKAGEAQDCFVKLAGSAKPFDRAEGLWGLERWDDAKRNFELALKAEPKNPLIPVRYGRLLLERFNKDESLPLFEQALTLQEDYPPALLAIAVLASEGFERKAAELAEKAVEKDPKSAEARELLSRLALEDGNLAKAREQADEAIKLSPYAFDAMALRAAADVIEDKPADPWLGRISAVNPNYAEAQAVVARLLVLNRRYPEAISYYRKAVEMNPRFWTAKSELGIQLMRVGEPVEARRQLEESYNNGYTNAATANSLKLLDSQKNFVTFKTSHGTLFLHKKEAAVMRPYLEKELAAAITTYERKYKMKAPPGVTIEMYPDHEDFAVRALGLPGLGALGVTFGSSIAMDSPSGRPPGSFHWGSTMWHELSHVFVISATNNRTPRWFTEGVAVHEETLVSPEWGDRLDPMVLKAIKDKKLLPIAQLDRGYMRPSYQGQVIVSYFQGGRVIDYIASKWGEEKINEMIRAFAKIEPTPVVVERLLGVKAEDFDNQFIAWLEEQHKEPLAKFEDWRKRLTAAVAASRKKDFDTVLKEAPELITWYPEYVEPGNAYELLASAYEATDKAKARDALDRYARAGGRSPDTLKKLAKLEEDLGRKKEAAAALARINYISPVGDEDLHRRLGDLYADLKEWPSAVVEYRALAASQPADPATANYNLARAYHALGRTAEAEEALLSALEAAPGFRPAQRMLLELDRSGGKKEKR